MMKYSKNGQWNLGKADDKSELYNVFDSSHLDQLKTAKDHDQAKAMVRAAIDDSSASQHVKNNFHGVVNWSKDANDLHDQVKQYVKKPNVADMHAKHVAMVAPKPNLNKALGLGGKPKDISMFTMDHVNQAMEASSHEDAKKMAHAAVDGSKARPENKLKAKKMIDSSKSKQHLGHGMSSFILASEGLSVAKSDEAHAPGSPEDSAHDVIEEGSSLLEEIGKLSPEEQSEMFGHLRQLVDKYKLRGKKNQNFGKD